MNSNFLLVLKLQISKRLKRKIKPRNQVLKLFKEKVTKIFIHGFLHLLGFDHKKNKDYSQMLKEENILLKSVRSKIN